MSKLVVVTCNLCGKCIQWLSGFPSCPDFAMSVCNILITSSASPIGRSVGHCAADHARTIARLRHADFPSSFNSVISRRRRQRSKACKGTRSSLTRMPICGAWSEDGRRHFPFSSTYFSTFCSSIWVRSFLNNDGKKREEPNPPPTDEPL